MRGGCWSIRATWPRRSGASRRRCASAGGSLPGGARRVPVRDHRRAARRGAARVPVRAPAGAQVGAGRRDALPRPCPAARPAWPRCCRGSSTASAGGGRGPVRFAAMELLLRAEREVSARRRLRDVAAAARAHGDRGRAAAGVRPPVRRGPLRPARGDHPLAERGDRARRLGEHAPQPAPATQTLFERRARRGPATSSSTCRPNPRSRWCSRPRVRRRPSPSCPAIARACSAALAGGGRLRAARRLRRGDARARRRSWAARRAPIASSTWSRTCRRRAGKTSRPALLAGGPAARRAGRERRRAVEQPRRRRA